MSGALSIYENIAAQDAEQYGVPVSLFENQINQESGFNPDAQNGDAEGIAQIEPGTASNPGYGLSAVDTSNPQASLAFAAQYDAALYNKTGSWEQTLADYGTTANGADPSLANLASQIDGGASVQDVGAFTPGPNNVVGNNQSNASSFGGSSQAPSWIQTLIGGVETQIKNTVVKYGSDAIVIVIGLLLIFGALIIWGKQITNSTKKAFS